MRTRLLDWLNTQRIKHAKQTVALTIRDADDRVSVTRKGGNITIQTEGDLNVDVHEIISSVGIKNLTDVVEHHITTIVGSRSHMVRFSNGGVLRFAYNAVGQLIELASQDLTVTISPGNAISFALPHEKTHTHTRNQTHQPQTT